MTGATERLRAALRGIAHATPPPKNATREALAAELAGFRLAARIALDSWDALTASNTEDSTESDHSKDAP